MSYATEQKQVIADVLTAAQRPLTAREVLDEAKKELPAMGIATVYRALKRMQAANEIRMVDIPGITPHYETWDTHHHHFFFCRQCRKVFNLEGCIAGVNKLAPKAFRVEGHEIILYGQCPQCA